MRDDINGRFLKGIIPWNANVKGIHLSPETEYKPGQHPSPATELKKGKHNKFWKGGKHNKDGYLRIYAPDNPRVKHTMNKYVFDHILKMEEHLGRYLTDCEIVHHINGNRLDNRIENLYLCSSRKNHTEIHKKMDKLLYSLINSGLVIFNKENGEYYINSSVV